MNRILITAATLAITASSAFAYGEATIDANEAVQANRIEQGRYTGQLTRREYRALKTEQARIQAMENRAKADGYVSKREYNRIHDAQINAYRHIKSESTDGQVSWYRRWLYKNR
jgi:uncharacterized membrane protein YebE (DUF533 family)